MAIKAPSIETWQALVSAYRLSQAADHRSASIQAKCTLATARKAWETGWPEHGFIAIRDSIERERVRARAARRKLEADARARNLALAEDAINDAAQARALVGLMVREGQQAAAALLSEARRLSLAISPLTSSVIEHIEEVANDPTASPADKVRTLNLFTGHVVEVMKLAKMAIDMEVQFLGKIDTDDSSDRRAPLDIEIDALMAEFGRLNRATQRLTAPPKRIPAQVETVEAKVETPTD